jgi:hypothetical protein
MIKIKKRILDSLQRKYFYLRYFDKDYLLYYNVFSAYVELSVNQIKYIIGVVDECIKGYIERGSHIDDRSIFVEKCAVLGAFALKGEYLNSLSKGNHSRCCEICKDFNMKSLRLPVDHMLGEDMVQNMAYRWHIDELMNRLYDDFIQGKCTPEMELSK